MRNGEEMFYRLHIVSTKQVLPQRFTHSHWHDPFQRIVTREFTTKSTNKETIKPKETHTKTNGGGKYTKTTSKKVN